MSKSLPSFAQRRPTLHAGGWAARNPQNKVFLTVSEAARYLGVATITARRWDRKGILKSERTQGGQRRYHKPALEAFKQRETERTQKTQKAYPKGELANEVHPGGATFIIHGTLAAQIIEKLSIGAKGFKNLLTVSKYAVPIKCAAVLVSALVLWQSSHALPQRPAPLPREQTRIVQGHTERAVSSRGSESDRGEVAGAKSNLVPTRTRNLSDTITQQVSKLTSSFVEWYLPKKDSDPVTSVMWILLSSSLVGIVTFLILYPALLLGKHGMSKLKCQSLVRLGQNRFILSRKLISNTLSKVNHHIWDFVQWMSLVKRMYRTYGARVVVRHLAAMTKQGHPLKARPLSPVGPSFHRAINLILTFLVISTLVLAGTSQLKQKEKGVTAAAGVPKILTYQGRLLDSNGTPISGGSLKMVFRIYTASSGGTASWTETRDGASGNPSKVSTSSTTGREGEFSVLLGDTSNSGTAITIDFNQDTYYLGIQVEDNSEMTPRIRITAAPYALNADTVDGINAALTATASTLYPLNADAKFPTSVLYSSNGANPSVSDYSLNTYVLSLDGSGNITASGNFRINTNAGTIVLRAASGNITLGDGTNTITNSDASTSLTLNSRKNINFFTERAGNIDSSGNLGILGYFITGSFAGVPASTASRNGEIIFDTTSNNIMAYNGGGWVGLGGGPALLTDGGAITYLISTSDDVALSGTTDSANFFLDHDKELRLQSINLNVNGAVNIAQSLNVRGVTQLGTVKTPTTTLDVFGSGNIDTNFNVLGNTRLGQGSTVTGTLPLDIFGSVNISGSLNVGSRLMIGDAAGKTLATVPLDVLGSFNVSGAANILGQCVTGDSLLTTKDGKNLRVDKVQGGEYILSLNQETEKLEPARVTALLDMGVRPIFKLTTKSGKTIRTTGNHPYLTKLSHPRGVLEGKPIEHTSPIKGAGWVKVMDLEKGDEIGVAESDSAVAPSNTFSWDTILSIDYVGEEQVYDLSIEGTHNFVAGHLVDKRTESVLTPRDEEVIGRLFSVGSGGNLVIDEQKSKGNSQESSADISSIDEFIQLIKTHDALLSKIMAKTRYMIVDEVRTVKSSSDGDKNIATKDAAEIFVQNPEYTLSAEEEKIVSLINEKLQELGVSVKVEDFPYLTYGGLIAHNTYLAGPVAISSTLRSPTVPLDVLGSVNISGSLNVIGVVSPNLIGSVGTGTAPQGIAVQGRYVYVSSNISNMLQVFDSSNTSSFNVLGSVGTGTGPMALAVSGRYAYVASNTTNIVQVIDISNPGSMNVVSSVGTGSAPRGIAIQGRYAYVTAQTGNVIQIFDISNPSSVNVVSSVGTRSNPTGIALSGRYAYVSVNGADMMEIYDITNPTSVNIVNSVVTGDQPLGIAIQGRYTYVISTGSNLLQVIDSALPASTNSVNVLSSVGTHTSPRHLTVQGRYAYLVNNTTATIQVVDVSNPTSINIVGSVGTGSAPVEIAVSGRFAYVTANTGNTLQVFDLGGTYLAQLEAGGIEAGSLQVRGPLIAYGDTDIKGGLTIGRGLSVTGPFSVNAGGVSSTFGIDYLGNIGLGTAYPTLKLDVGGTGSVNIAGALNVLGSTQLGTRKLATTVLDLLGSLNVSGSTNIRGSVMVGAPALAVAPTVPLDVLGSANMNSLNIWLSATTDSLNVSPRQAGASANFLFVSGGTACTGCVGVGTTSPGRKLAVGGAIGIDNAQGVGSFLSGGSTYFNLIGSNTDDTISVGDGTASTWGAIRFFPGAAEAMRITSGGNLGIGTTVPATRLDIAAAGALNVAGAANILGSVQIGTRKAATVPLDVLGSVNMNSLNIYLSSSTDSLNVSPRGGSSANFLFVNGGSTCTGCVGIGTTAPGTGTTGQGGTTFALTAFEFVSTGRPAFAIKSASSTHDQLTTMVFSANNSSTSKDLHMNLDSSGEFSFYSYSAASYVQMWDASGNVGIGTIVPGSRVQITGGGLCVGSDANCNTDNNTEGTVYSGSTSMTLYDVAENYPTKDTTLVPEEVVELDPDNQVFVKRASSPYSKMLLGIISEKPAVHLGGFNGAQFKEERQVAVALVGRVPVKVSTENGEIKTGDYLTSSSLPGIAMKATRPGEVIGKALESFSGSSGEQCPTGSLLLGGEISQRNSNGSQKDGYIEKQQVDIVNVSHNLPFLADQSDSQPITTNPTNPNSTIAQLGVSIPNTAGTTTEPNDKTEILPNNDDNALNSERVNPTPPVCGKVITFVNVSFADPSTVLAQLSFDPSGNIVNTMNIQSITTSSPSPYVSVEQVRVVSDNTTPEVSSSVSLLTQLKDAVEGILGKQTDLEKRLTALETQNALSQEDCVIEDSLLLGNKIEQRYQDQDQEASNIEQRQTDGGVVEGHNFPRVANTTENNTEKMVPAIPNPTTGHLETSIAPVNTGTTSAAKNTAEKLVQTNESARKLDFVSRNTTVLCDTGRELVKSLSIQSANAQEYIAPEDIDTLSLNTQTVKEVLTVLGRTSLGATSIAGLFTQDGTLVIDKGNEISVVGTGDIHDTHPRGELQSELHPGGGPDTDSGILYLQRSPFSRGLDILAGKVRIDTQGNVQITGDIHVAGKIKTGGVRIAKESVGKEIGTGVIPSGETAVVIETPVITDDTHIFITPLSDIEGQSLYIFEKVPGAGFIAAINAPLSYDLVFDWFIVIVE